MIDSTSITKKIEDHKSTIIEELSQTEIALKEEISKYRGTLEEQMKEDLTKLQNSSKLQEQEQKQNIQKLLKLVGWKVLIPISLLSLIVGIIVTMTFYPKETPIKWNFDNKVIQTKDNSNYLMFQEKELIYDKTQRVYFYKIN